MVEGVETGEAEVVDSDVEVDWTVVGLVEVV